MAEGINFTSDNWDPQEMGIQTCTVVSRDPRGFRSWVHPCSGQRMTQYSDGEIVDAFDQGIVTGDFVHR